MNIQREKRVAILQSNYIPWKGYFDIIGKVDEFIVYDEVQFTKNDWRNRNRIKTPQGAQWITVPVYNRGLSQKISETFVSQPKWASKHWTTILVNYSKAPFFKEMSDVFEKFYKTIDDSRLSFINLQLIEIICSVLEIQTRITNSTNYTLEGGPTERLVNLCKQSAATSYLTGPAAKNYLNEDLFLNEGIKVEWMDYKNYPQYPQINGPFIHDVSVLDLLFNAGKNSRNYMKFSNT